MSDKKGKDQSDGLDPDIAALLEIEPQADTESAPATDGEAAEGEPGFDALFDAEKGAPPQAVVVDGSRKGFVTIAQLQEEPKGFFNDPDFYKTVLAGEGEAGQRVHEILGKYMKAQDPEEKSGHRAKLITAFQELGSSIASHMGRELPVPKKLLLRFGILSPSFLTPELRDMVSRFVFENRTDEPIWYMDEWLEMISKGQVRLSTTDEVRQKNKDTSLKVVEAVEKKRGQRDNELTVLRGRMSQLDEQEAMLREHVETLLRHEFSEEHEGFKLPFGAAQKQSYSQIQDILRRLSSLDSQIASSYTTLSAMEKDLEVLERKSEGLGPGSVVDSKSVEAEYASVRQMAKMTVGKKGNHFPIFISQYIVANLRDIGIRENLINEMAAVEHLDPGLFLRTHKGQTARIVPNTLLLPSYGETGVCWEPFEKFNRSTSRGRIAVPMFSKNLRLAVLTALADLRWQVAKEKAQYYWMEEGITGKYYQWFSANKLRGDVREYFIRDYVLWITKESQGMQKLDKEVRGIFWRTMPFPQEIKDSLKNRGFFYSELYKKDQNIARSDGY